MRGADCVPWEQSDSNPPGADNDEHEQPEGARAPGQEHTPDHDRAEHRRKAQKKSGRVEHVVPWGAGVMAPPIGVPALQGPEVAGLVVQKAKRGQRYQKGEWGGASLPGDRRIQSTSVWRKRQLGRCHQGWGGSDSASHGLGTGRAWATTQRGRPPHDRYPSRCWAYGSETVCVGCGRACGAT